MMFNKAFLILFVIIQLYTFSLSFLQISGLAWQPFHQSDIVMAAQLSKQALQSDQAVNPTWQLYILPGAAVFILIAGIGSYWLFYRRKII